MARKSLKDLMAQLDQPRVQKIKERRTDGQRPSIEEWMGIDSASEPDVALSKSSKLSAEDWLHATVPATGAVPAGRTQKGKEEGGKEEGAARRKGKEDTASAQGAAIRNLNGKGRTDEGARKRSHKNGKTRVSDEDEDADELDYSDAQEKDENGKCEWPKLDINRQFFSSKEEPMMLCKELPAQVSRTRTECLNTHSQTQTYKQTQRKTTHTHANAHVHTHTHACTNLNASCSSTRDAAQANYSAACTTHKMCTYVQVPAHVAKYLRDYQREGVEWLYDKYRNNTGVFLCLPLSCARALSLFSFSSSPPPACQR